MISNRILPAATLFWAAVGLLTASVAAQAPPAEYAGSDTCALCHEDLHTRFLKNPHAVLETSGRLKYVGQSCESCHGPGLGHAENEGDKARILSFKTAPKADQEAACMKCHGMQAAHAGAEAALHSRGGGPTCTECHSIHAPAAAFNLVKSSPATLCLGCHSERRADFRKPYHHKVLEGGMSCTDCHQPHGGPLPRQLKSAAAQPTPCVRCHADKAGPFVFEHAGRRLGDCTACHNPHGANNPKMLVRNTVQALCLECHTLAPNIPGSQPPSIHNLQTARYRNCTTCHLKIHGSNTSRLFFR